MKSIVSSFMASILLVLLISIGGATIYLYDRRPADFPSIHIHPQLLFFKLPGFDWTAPDSLEVSSYKAGALTQSKIDNFNCLRTTERLRIQVTEQTAAAEKAHNEELQVEKQTLQAQREAVMARKKEAWTLSGIDHMKTRGNSCQRAEQVIRGVIK